MENNNIQNNIPSKEAITQEIVKVVVFFDMFDFPLTLLEIWQGLAIKCGFEEVREALRAGAEGIEEKKGFYFLGGRAGLFEKRLRQYDLEQEKFKIARRSARFLKAISGVKMIAVCNNFSYKKESDIDLFIITESRRLWLTRFLVTVFVQLLGLRRHGLKIANRLCLSFYASEEALDLNGLRLGEDDVYFNYWLLDLMPIYDSGNTLERFRQKNQWLKKSLPNAAMPLPVPRYLVEDGRILRPFKRIDRFLWQSFLGGALEALVRKIQKSKMKRNKKSHMNDKGTGVVISGSVLKFHEHDRREEYRERWKRHCLSSRGELSVEDRNSENPGSRG